MMNAATMAGKDARLHITRAWSQGKPIKSPLRGASILFMLVGSQTFPKNVSEYEFAGGIKGSPFRWSAAARPTC